MNQQETQIKVTVHVEVWSYGPTSIDSVKQVETRVTHESIITAKSLALTTTEGTIKVCRDHVMAELKDKLGVSRTDGSHFTSRPKTQNPQGDEVDPSPLTPAVPADVI